MCRSPLTPSPELCLRFILLFFFVLGTKLMTNSFAVTSMSSKGLMSLRAAILSVRGETSRGPFVAAGSPVGWQEKGRGICHPFPSLARKKVPLFLLVFLRSVPLPHFAIFLCLSALPPPTLPPPTCLQVASLRPKESSAWGTWTYPVK